MSRLIVIDSTGSNHFCTNCPLVLRQLCHHSPDPRRITNSRTEHHVRETVELIPPHNVTHRNSEEGSSESYQTDSEIIQVVTIHHHSVPKNLDCAIPPSCLATAAAAWSAARKEINLSVAAENTFKIVDTPSPVNADLSPTSVPMSLMCRIPLERINIKDVLAAVTAARGNASSVTNIPNTVFYTSTEIDYSELDVRADERKNNKLALATLKDKEETPHNPSTSALGKMPEGSSSNAHSRFANGDAANTTGKVRFVWEKATEGGSIDKEPSVPQNTCLNRSYIPKTVAVDPPGRNNIKVYTTKVRKSTGVEEESMVNTGKIKTTNVLDIEKAYTPFKDTKAGPSSASMSETVKKRINCCKRARIHETGSFEPFNFQGLDTLSELNLIYPHGKRFVIDASATTHRLAMEAANLDLGLGPMEIKNKVALPSTVSTSKDILNPAMNSRNLSLPKPKEDGIYHKYNMFTGVDKAKMAETATKTSLSAFDKAKNTDRTFVRIASKPRNETLTRHTVHNLVGNSDSVVQATSANNTKVKKPNDSALDMTQVPCKDTEAGTGE